MNVFDAERLNQCIGCGLCLGSCPTYRVTGLESASPRGRVDAMRAVDDGLVDLMDPTFGAVMEECVQCRACEAVCPSGVQFGALMETARAARHERGARKAGPMLAAVRHRSVLVVTALGLALVQLLRLDRLLPARLRVPRRVRVRDVLRPLAAPGHGDPVWFFRGCVMDVWERPVHQAAVDVLAASGLRARWPRPGLCCGALHLHQGRHAEAVAMARRVVAAYGGDERVVIDSAGCGAMLKEYGELLGTPEARAFSARVLDLSEVPELRRLRPVDGAGPRVGYQAACHLRNVQRIVDAPVELLRDVAGCSVDEGSEPGVCCGAGGLYATLQPELAGDIRDRKAADLAGHDAVVTTNPGCELHLAAAGLPMRHLAEVLAERTGARGAARRRRAPRPADE